MVGIRGEWSQDGDNNNFIDHLQKGQSLVCIRELEVVVDAASTGGQNQYVLHRPHLTLNFTGALVTPVMP